MILEIGYKMNKLNRLTWKYFFEQKWEEVKDFFEENGLGIFAFTFAVGLSFQILWVKDLETGLPIWKTGAIIGLFVVGFWVLIGLIALIKCIVNWIRDNWKRAKEKAKKKIKEKK